MGKESERKEVTRQRYKMENGNEERNYFPQSPWTGHMLVYVRSVKTPTDTTVTFPCECMVFHYFQTKSF
jgi:hypothetical protein